MRHRSFRLLLSGLLMSETGTWMQIVAEGWLVYRLTGSPLALGLVQFVAVIPLAPLMLVAGVLSDRVSRRGLLAAVQVLQAIPPAVLAFLTWRDNIQVWHVVAASTIMVGLATIDRPTRLALVGDVTDPQHFDAGMALAASGLNLARVVGPALAGVLVASIGESACFALNGLSFLAVTGALLAMKLPTQPVVVERESFKADLVAGGRHLAQEPALLAALGMGLLVSLFVLPYQTLLPVFARDMMGLDALGLGLLTAATGLGTALGGAALIWLSVNFPGKRGATLTLLALGLPFGVFGFAASRSFLLSCLTLTLVAASVLALRTLVVTLIQASSPESLRGRVMSILFLLIQGAARAGSLASGYVAERFTAPHAVALGALGCLTGALIVSALVPGLYRVP